MSLVQNGIIENYSELKKELISDGAVFTSDTDTEVIPHLIQKELKFISAYNEPKKVEQPLTNILPVFDPPKPIQPDPETLRLEQRYKQILEESEREKRRNQKGN